MRVELELKDKELNLLIEVLKQSRGNIEQSYITQAEICELINYMVHKSPTYSK